MTNYDCSNNNNNNKLLWFESRDMAIGALGSIPLKLYDIFDLLLQYQLGTIFFFCVDTAHILRKVIYVWDSCCDFTDNLRYYSAYEKTYTCLIKNNNLIIKKINK